ncbi:MAG: aquaporin [Nitrososphaerales archaeon]|jgi:aquaporin Z
MRNVSKSPLGVWQYVDPPKDVTKPVFAVFGTTVYSRALKNGGFSICLEIAICLMVGRGQKGATMNPARAIGPAIASGYFANWYMYWI